MHTFRIFGWSFAITVAGVAVAGVLGGPEAAALVAILSVLEISLSFDNAVINATILRRMNEFWQKIFLTIGVLIAVFGMRLLFPIVIVMVTAGLGPGEVFDLALNDTETYGHKLDEAHPAIAAFGGIFLFMIFLDFMFDTERDVRWLKWIETPLAKIGELNVLPVVIGLAGLLVTAETLAAHSLVGDATEQVLTAGVAGLATYLGVRGLGEFFEARGIGEDDEDGEDDAGEAAGTESKATGQQVAEADVAAGALASDRPAAEPVTAPAAPAAPAAPTRNGGPNGLVLASGRAAFFLFLYLEVLDASFSFDGVVGAFAISQNIFIIAAGLGIGALYIRSITVYLVRKGTLQEYIYLEHGAHYAIGALAVILAISVRYEVPEIVTGLIGVGFIAIALVSSIRHRRRQPDDPANEVNLGGTDGPKESEPALL